MLKRKKPMRRSGKKTAQWDRIRAKLKQECLERAICSCELRLKGCLGSMFLGFAHRKKRRFCDEAELHIACLACSSCHLQADSLPAVVMFDLVDTAIKRRP
jgi:hypothetical protein